jgi:hypothetical protein
MKLFSSSRKNIFDSKECQYIFYKESTKDTHKPVKNLAETFYSHDTIWMLW